MQKRLMALGFSAAIALAMWGAQAQLPLPSAPEPDALMKAVTAEVTAILKDDIASGSRTDVARVIEEKILPLFDFQRMTQLAVARAWRQASAEQRSALVAEFRRLLVRTYSGSLAAYRNQVIEYKRMPGAAGEAESEVLVRSWVRRPGSEAVTIDYDMAHTPAGWQVYDVTVSGVSLVITYRESFAAAVREGGIDGLIKALADKNRQAADGLRPGQPAAAGRTPS
jgi:phospholipid transport system substrate-binding protein